MAYKQAGSHPSSAATSKALESPEQSREEVGAGSEEEDTPQVNFSSSSPDEAVMPSPLSVADDFKSFQDLAERVAEALQIHLQEVTEPHHKLVDILHSSTSARMALPVNGMPGPCQSHGRPLCPSCQHANRWTKSMTCQRRTHNFPFPPCLLIPSLWMRLILGAARPSLNPPRMSDWEVSGPVRQKGIFISRPPVPCNKLSGFAARIGLLE